MINEHEIREQMRRKAVRKAVNEIVDSAETAYWNGIRCSATKKLRRAIYRALRKNALI